MDGKALISAIQTCIEATLQSRKYLNEDICLSTISDELGLTSEEFDTLTSLRHDEYDEYYLSADCKIAAECNDLAIQFIVATADWLGINPFETTPRRPFALPPISPYLPIAV